MNAITKHPLRQIHKIYPPQLSHHNNQHWLQTHSSSSLTDLVQIQSNTTPLFLNTFSDEIIMQNSYEIFVVSQQTQWMKTIKKEFISEEQIISQTTKINQNYLNINKQGGINLWKCQQELQNSQYNPQSLKDVLKCKQPTVINTTINSQKLVKQYRHGYNFASIMVEEGQRIYTLHQYQNAQNNNSKKIVRTEIGERQGDSSYYQCFLPSNITKLINFGNNICAYGGQNGIIIDKRSESIVCDFNNEEQSSINCIKYNENKNTFYICRDKKLLQLDPRNYSLQQTPFTFEDVIDNIQLFTQEQKDYCALSFKTSSQIAIMQI